MSPIFWKNEMNTTTLTRRHSRRLSIRISGDGTSITRLEFLPPRLAASPCEVQPGFGTSQGEAAKRLLLEAFAQLEAYFAGELRQFSLPLAPVGTDFEQSVWAALCQVPFGETASYRDIAEAVGRPLAVRAVGNANGKNPIPIFIPCHRIIRSDGTPGGYSCGIEIKKKLLRLESR